MTEFLYEKNGSTNPLRKLIGSYHCTQSSDSGGMKDYSKHKSKAKALISNSAQDFPSDKD